VTTSENPVPSPTKSPAWLLFVLPVAAGLALSGIICLCQWLREDTARFFFIGLDGMCWLLGIGVLCILGFSGLVAYLRVSAKSIAWIVAALMVAMVALTQVLRIDGYYGNRTPRLAWRWTPAAEDNVKRFLASKSTTKPHAASRELFSKTRHDFSALLGSERDGRVDGINLATDWQASPPVLLWRHPVGLGWSGFSVVGRAAINLEQRDTNECVVCYDVRTGMELWCHGEPTRFRHEYGDGPRSTPTIHNGRVFSMGATGILTCIDLESGILVWKQSVFEDADKQNLLFGMCGSPVVFDNNVVVTPGGAAGSSAICFDVDSGEEVWRSGDDPASYSSPTVVELAGHRQLLSFNGAGLRAYDLMGASLWLQPWVTQGESRVNVAQPIVVDSNLSENQTELSARIVISSGYDKGTALVKVTQQKGQWSAELVWNSNHLKSKLSNFVVRDDFVYGLDNGLLTCLNLANGQRMWKRGRYGHGKLLLVKDKLLIQAESGEVILVVADATSHQELTRFQPLDSKTWNYPALAGNVLVVRNDREAAAFELPMHP